MNIFVGFMKILWIFLGSSQNWTSFRDQFYVFNGLCLGSRYIMRPKPMYHEKK